MNGILCAYLRAQTPEHAERRGDAVAAAFDGELDDVLGIEVDRVGREARARRVLDALVDRQDRDIARAGQAPVFRIAWKLRSTCGERSVNASTRLT